MHARFRIGASAAAVKLSPQAVEVHHSPNARFQSGNRVYQIVVLGQGGVGKSGERTVAAFAGWLRSPRAHLSVQGLYSQSHNLVLGCPATLNSK